MNDPIDWLSPEQARQALAVFYELLPEELWEEAKPSAEDVRFLSQEGSVPGEHLPARGGPSVGGWNRDGS